MAFLQAELPWTTIPLTASTAKTVGSLKAPTNQILRVLEFQVSHDGATSANAPDVTDLARCTFATSGTGTATTPGKKIPAFTETIQATGTTNYTAEPTVVTPLRSFNLAQYNGMYHYIVPFAAPLLVQGGQGILIRHNSPNAVNATGSIEYEE
jgi:hypothetical protein